MKVSVLQFKPWLHKKTENIEQLTAMLKGLNTDLVVLPELAVSGYVFAEKKEPWANFFRPWAPRGRGWQGAFFDVRWGA